MAAVVGIVDPGPPSHFNISPFRSLFPDDLDDVHSILLPPPWRNAFRLWTTNRDRRADYRRPVNGGPARMGVPDSKPLPNATFIAQNEKGTATSFTTDDQGSFRVSLVPGHYTVSLKEKKGGIGSLRPLPSRCSSRPDGQGRMAL
jgi:hypothetical protein